MERVDPDQDKKMREKIRQNNVKAYLAHREEYIQVLAQIMSLHKCFKGTGKGVYKGADLFPSLDPQLRTRLKNIGTNLMLMEELLDETIKKIEDEDTRNIGGYSKREWIIQKGKKLQDDRIEKKGE